jgi:2,5-furandicarboxylate decarboxylase 1
VPGISDEHTLLLAVPQEARLLRALRQHHPNVTAVAYPKSGTCRFHAYVAVRDPASGQARNIAATTLGDDLSLKLVVVVDDDVDVTRDFDILWAMTTRMQADSDIDVIRNAMGAVLDPSNRQGTTAELIVDATRKTTPYPRRQRAPTPCSPGSRYRGDGSGSIPPFEPCEEIPPAGTGCVTAQADPSQALHGRSRGTTYDRDVGAHRDCGKHRARDIR